MPWYENRYRRHLLDMHIEDWDDRFLRDFSPERYVENLKRGQVQTAMLYFQSHVGYSYYPTATGHMHKAFEGREDAMRRLVDLCHENGIDVVGYYSLNYNNFAHDAHADWRMVGADGLSLREKGASRYGLCCPNNADYRRFVEAQIDEMCGYFVFEGMFYDMPFWPMVCCCPSCRDRFTRETGEALPTSRNDPNWKLFEDRRRIWLGEFSAHVTDHTKKRLPHVSVSQNFAFAALPSSDTLVSDLIGDACDYVGGDLYESVFTQSFACKYYLSVTKNQPYEYMTGRCNPSLQSHTITKSKDKLTLAALLTLAHKGANLFIDAIDPVGTMDERFYSLLGEIYADTARYEPFLSDQTERLAAKVGVFYSLENKRNAQGQKNTNYSGSINAMRSLIGRHIPVSLLSEPSLNKIGDLDVLFLSNPVGLDEAAIDALVGFVEKGGLLYMSNADATGLFSRLTGGRITGYTEHKKTYLAPASKALPLFEGFNEAYPLPFDYRLPIAEGLEACEILATVTLPYTVDNEMRFASIHSNPPGVPTDYPALAVKRVGKGRVVWSAAPFENELISDYMTVLLNVIGQALPAGKTLSFIQTDAPRNVELVSFASADGGSLRISAVQLFEEDDALTLPPFRISVQGGKRAKRVVCLPDGEEISFEQDDKQVSFTLKALRIFGMYQIQYEE